MLIVVTGGSASGKSLFAENLALQIRKNSLVYLATMKHRDKETLMKIHKHQQMRQGKGFSTIECYKNIAQLQVTKRPTLLLECMSNLLANEMYSEKQSYLLDKSHDVISIIMEGIKNLMNQCENVIVVTNEIFSDGNYQDDLKDYYGNLGKINQTMGVMASHVYEVVYGIPICVKGKF